MKELSKYLITEDGKMTKSYVWSFFTRLFHIFLVVTVAFLFLFAEFDNLLSYHVIIGYTVGVLFLFRIIWGFLDVKYSKFQDFNFNLYDLKEYMFNIFGSKKEYIGHNPASSWAIVAMITLGILSVLSGVFVYGTQEGMGIFSFLNTTIFKKMEFFEEIHEFFTTAFMIVIFAHIAGVLLERVLHGPKTLESMINGYKEVEAQSLKLTLFQKLFGVFWIGGSIFFLIYMLSHPTNILIADANKAVDYQKEHPLFENECRSCHTLYPPYLLPKASWVKLMDNLENHFGDDASLEATDTVFIKDYLVNNAAEDSTKEAAFKILKSMKEKDTIAITKTSYWKRRHQEIDQEIFASAEVKAKSNCKACHNNIEQGLLNDKDIKIPDIAKG
ncbi:cytochrome b/b6 domain-containing protein [Sulfurimonas sp. C5]|uniref:cytochrome b/b6 domain-containing protein n=1 Tax=Sulfurimonas sp. C5 TaxID=3036947 RepID=UPI00245458FB|nr:cytochrome b/b6 domain-containing protein [Sulfurimonas sp. C5]MDH4944050.1 cytochrome b/b6 domain-containing protein [Sulfurimonas sp. C5]